MEIGSEYWLEDKQNSKDSVSYFQFGIDNRFLLSGRIAIGYVLDDILNTRKINKVYFPSYCCSSMLQPFYDRGIKVDFYSVDYTTKLEYNIDLNCECDIFFAMSYFGFSSTNMDSYIANFKQRGIIVIEDITHRLLCNEAFCKEADYLVASLRKWFPLISGGLAVCLNDKFGINESEETNNTYVKARKEAMLKKRDYIVSKKDNKKEFLEQYNLANKMLENTSVNFKIDKESYNILNALDINKIKITRIKNAKIIYEALKNENYSILVNELTNNDCPLFVPIILKKRDALRKYLIDKGIYCPAHWPLPNGIKSSNIFEEELSLICDQRYNTKDIETYISIILKFLKEN